MLYWLLYEKLFPFFHPFRIFRYLTFRTVFASLTALLIAMFIGPYVIQKLREFQIGQYIREDGPQSHQKKSGTPTMGGVLIVIAILLPTVLWSDPANPFVWIAVCSTLAYGAIGFADDYTKVVHRRNLGLTARAKLLWQGLAGAGVGIALVVLTQFKLFATQLSVPFLKVFHPDLQWHHWPSTLPHLGLLAFVPFVAFVIFVLMSTSNAVNLTDGLDGLAIGCTIIAGGALTVLTYVSGHVVFADYLELQRMPLVAELTVFCGSMVGASIGFLWYNAHPAEVFMGDVGSLALGGAIGTVAVIIRQEFLLPFIGGIFVLEALSVVLQVGSYKLRKKRIFKMAPLHHHFEQLGWSESKVIVRFWIGALVFALFALTTLKLR
ncbi:phospho-N-acetylmuramoyl-pentapeptide-transferase [Telmatobacter sp. DSM 110680]|uniref:Phospho-N-acetylmuramoyl-pentapeptide-transferase n=1 Tax=Telmatobacter sp. DSM 110680 TaxID=3036704 RepID=A0AAU7DGM4_9BACT